MNKIIAILLSVFLLSCTENKIEIENLTLNNGDKWEANIETTNGITQMQTLISKFNGISIEDYHNLNSELKREFNKIIKACNMEGDAHDQLHHYIKPILLDYFKKIDSKDIEEVKDGLNQLNIHLNEYTTYFK
ncbi:MAG: hypothetical protein H8E84_01835 [Flavobacteriales bacterium]|nr:hypothetical protein [Flavobacteriales bacterium]